MHKFFLLSIIVFFIIGCTVVPPQAQISTVSPTTKAMSSTEVVVTSPFQMTKTLTPIFTSTSADVTTLDLTSVAYATQSSVYGKYCDGINGYLFNDNWGICDRSSHNFTLFNLDGRILQYSFENLNVV